MSGQDARARHVVSYADAGVDIGRGNAFVDQIKPLVRSTLRPGADAEIGGFGGIFDLKAAGYADPLLVAANDGVGTKVKIAIETGIHDTVGIDLVAMCVNDLVVQGAEPLFFLDYYATGKLDPEVGHGIVKGIAEGCRQSGCALIGGETAEMPGLYTGGDYDLAGFSVGAVDRDKLLPRSDIEEGDVLLALASSGVHSNGFSLVRRVVSDAGLGWMDSAPFAPDRQLGEALLTPTRIYVKFTLEAVRSTGAVKALAHITGGGLTENLPRVLPSGVVADIDLSTFTLPPVFDWLSQAASIEKSELLRTFNCGVGMVAVVDANGADAVSRCLRELGETVWQIGRLSAGDSEQPVRYSGELSS